MHAHRHTNMCMHVQTCAHTHTCTRVCTRKWAHAQAEVFNGAILQQSFVVDFVVENNMCPDCNRFNANPNSWTACAQVCKGSRADLIFECICLIFIGVHC